MRQDLNICSMASATLREARARGSHSLCVPGNDPAQDRPCWAAQPGPDSTESFQLPAMPGGQPLLQLSLVPIFVKQHKRASGQHRSSLSDHSSAGLLPQGKKEKWTQRECKNKQTTEAMQAGSFRPDTKPPGGSASKDSAEKGRNANRAAKVWALCKQCWWTGQDRLREGVQASLGRWHTAARPQPHHTCHLRRGFGHFSQAVRKEKKHQMALQRGNGKRQQGWQGRQPQHQPQHHLPGFAAHTPADATHKDTAEWTSYSLKSALASWQKLLLQNCSEAEARQKE